MLCAVFPQTTHHDAFTMFSAGRRALARPATAAIGRVTPNASASKRLLSALAILEQRDGQLSTGSLSAVTAAKAIGGTVHAFLAGASVKTAAEQAAKVDGVEKIVTVDNAAYEKVSPWNNWAAGQFLTIVIVVGSPRELCSSARRKYQEGRIYTYYCRQFGL